jgi:hypothetical protein
VPKPSCPWCGGTRSAVFRSAYAPFGDGYLRRRQCRDCGHEFPTIEILDAERFERQLTLAGLTLRDLGLTRTALGRARSFPQ